MATHFNITKRKKYTRSNRVWHFCGDRSEICIPNYFILFYFGQFKHQIQPAANDELARILN